MKKKLLAIITTVSLMCSMMFCNAFAEQVDWNTYYTGPGAAYPTDIVSLTYQNSLTNYVKATYISGTNAKVTVSGVNVNMYDIPSGSYKTYTFTASSMSSNIFRPVSKSGTISKGTYQCASQGSSTYYTQGYLKY